MTKTKTHHSLQDIADIVNGELCNINDPQKPVGNYQIRPIACSAKSLFIAYDWPPLLPLAATQKVIWRAIRRKRALAALTDYEYDPQSPLPLIRVSNANDALRILAKKSRDQFTGSLVAITGTAGKSSTKAMLGKVLGEYGRTWVTQSNQNLTPHILANLCELNNSYAYASMETGLSQAGTLEEVMPYVHPDIAVITSIGVQHTEGFDDPYEQILEEKCAILRHARKGAAAILPSSSDRFEALLAQAQNLPNIGKIITCGFREADDIQITNHQTREWGQNLTLKAGDEVVSFELNYPNPRIASNAALVAGVLLALKLPLAAMSILKDTPPVHSQYHAYEAQMGDITFQIVNDGYNSSPISVEGLTEYIASRTASRKLIALASNPSLGAQSKAIHSGYAEGFADAGLDYGVFFGSETDQLAQSTRFASDYFEDSDAAFSHLLTQIQNGDLLFLKGSVPGKKQSFIEILKARKDITLKMLK